LSGSLNLNSNLRKEDWIKTSNISSSYQSSFLENSSSSGNNNNNHHHLHLFGSSNNKNTNNNNNNDPSSLAVFEKFDTYNTKYTFPLLDVSKDEDVKQLNEEERKSLMKSCENCEKLYKESQNAPRACCYHRGVFKTSTAKYTVAIQRWSCCKAEQFSALGCVVGPHVESFKMTKILDSFNSNFDLGNEDDLYKERKKQIEEEKKRESEKKKRFPTKYPSQFK